MNWFEVIKNIPETNYEEEGNQSCCNQAKMNIRKEVPQLYDVMWKNGYFDQRGMCQILKKWFTNKLDWNGKPVVDSGKRLRLEQKKKGWLQDWEDCEKMSYSRTGDDNLDVAVQRVMDKYNLDWPGEPGSYEPDDDWKMI